MHRRLFFFFVLFFLYSSANADVRLWYYPYYPVCGSSLSAVTIADCVIDERFSSSAYSRYEFECESSSVPYYSSNGAKYYKPVKRSQYDTCSRTTSYTASVEDRKSVV